MKLLELPSSHILYSREIYYNSSTFIIERTHDTISIFNSANAKRILIAQWDLFLQKGTLLLHGKEKIYKRVHNWKKGIERLTGSILWEDFFNLKLPKPFLNIDPSFKPVTRRHYNGEADEMFTQNSIRWNITMMEEWIDNNKDSVELRDFEVTSDYVKYIESGFIRTNPEHIPNVNVNKPLIVVQTDISFNGRFSEMLIDGHHRLLKAAQEGITHLKSYILTIEQHIPFLMYTLDETFAYRTLIHNWNESVEFFIRKSKKLSSN